MVAANREMVVYCFDTLVAHYNSEQSPPPAFDGAQQYLSLLPYLSPCFPGIIAYFLPADVKSCFSVSVVKL